MKCYNCDSVITMQAKCQNCGIKLDKNDYNLPSTQKILKNITNIKEFANFIGLFYVKNIYLLISSIVSILLALYFLLILKNNLVYVVLAMIFVFSFTYYLEMKKIEKFYADFEKNNNHYYILWPLHVEFRTFFTDANEMIPTKSILKKRISAFQERRKNERFLRFNSYKLLHPQKPKLFMEKSKFKSKFLPQDKVHYLESNNYDDESYVAVEGTIHGFLIMDSKVITLFNIPRLAKTMLKAGSLEELYIKK